MTVVDEPDWASMDAFERAETVRLIEDEGAGWSGLSTVITHRGGGQLAAGRFPNAATGLVAGAVLATIEIGDPA